MKKMVAVSCFFLLIATGLYAQSHTDAAGGNLSGPGGTVSYSIGQIDYSTKNGPGGVITEGVQQPIEILEVTTGIKEASNDNTSVLAYPNPTSGSIELQISTITNEQLTYELFDQTGCLIQQNPITAAATTINMTSLTSGIYFIKVFNSNKTMKSFKIIKTS